MTKPGIEDTTNFNQQDLDFIKEGKIEIDNGLVYSGRGAGSFVVFITGPDKGNVIAIDKGKMIIGRDAASDIIVNKKYISKKHAKIVTTGSKTEITDFGSKNGTYVNEALIKNAELKDRDEIRIGDIIIKYFKMDLADKSLDQALPYSDDMASAFYKQVFEELKPYFGQMTARFLNRQITAHVGKTPDTVSSSDKKTLAKWIKISAGLLLDEKTAERLADKISNLK